MVSPVKKVHFASFVHEKTFDPEKSWIFSASEAKENLNTKPEKSCIKGKKVTYLKKLFTFDGLSTCKKIFKIAALIFLGFILIPFAYYKDCKQIKKI